MSQINAYSSPGDLLKKVVREARRVNFATTDNELSDSFFNFCVSAHSLRDWCIKELGWENDNQKKRTFHEECNMHSNLQNVRDVANGSKHLGLDSGRSSTVKEVKTTSDTKVYISAAGNTLAADSEATPSAKVIYPDGTDVLAIAFMVNTISNWKNIFEKYQLYYDQDACSEINVASL